MTDEPPPDETQKIDEERDALLADLSEGLNEILIESHLRPHEDLWIRVDKNLSLIHI